MRINTSTNIKSFHDLVPPMRSAAFRKVICDGRSCYIRQIPTLRTLRREVRQPVATEPATMVSGRQALAGAESATHTAVPRGRRRNK